MIIFSWIPVVLLLFATLPPRHAVIIATITAWLFLPNLAFSLPGIPDYTKMSATTGGIVLGVLIFDPGAQLKLRPRWFDLPIVIWCLAPLASSLSNGLGVYDGCSGLLGTVVQWGFPYLIGRIYFADLEGLRELAIGVVVGGLIYTPLCLFEIKFSPQLERYVYGMGGWEGERFGGYRPRVFMGVGLLLGMWMTAASLIAYWMWANGALRRLRGISFGGPLLVLLVVTLLCKSTGALTLLAFGLLIRWMIRWTGWALPIWLLVAVTPLYEVTRASNLWSGRELVDLSRSATDEDRAGSLWFRLINEDILAAKALQRPVFGWGGWGRARVYNAEGRDISVTDGYWIITLGNHGIVGLASLTASFLLPLALLTFRYRVRSWTTPAVAPAAAFAVLLGLYMIDNLSNAMPNPIYTLAIGGLSALRPGRVDGEDRQEDEGGEALADHARGRSGVPLFANAEGLLAVRQRELAERWTAAGYAKEAEQAWRRALGLWRARTSIRPDDRGRRDLVLGYERFGRFLRDHGKLREAAETWQAALDLLAESTTDPADQPESVAAGLDLCNDLAWLLANGLDLASRDPARAVALASKAVEAELGCATYWNTLGVAHYRAGECQAAIAALGRAVELGSGGTGFDHLFLAMAHARQGDHENALIWFDRGASWIENYGSDHVELRRLRDEAEDLLRH